jgi:hypothetical protein
LKPYVVPIDFPEDAIPLPISRSIFRSTFIGIIGLDGTTLKTEIIIHRKTIEAELYEFGYENECQIYYEEARSITTQIFEDWFDRIQISEIEQRRTKYQYNGERVPILDGCSTHFSEYIIDKYFAKSIHIIVMPVHPSDQLQRLDLVIFAVSKCHAKLFAPDDDLKTQTIHVIKILGNWGVTTAPFNFISAFRRGRIYLKFNNNQFEVTVNPTKTDNIRHYQKSKVQFSKEQIVI